MYIVYHILPDIGRKSENLYIRHIIFNALAGGGSRQNFSKTFSGKTRSSAAAEIPRALRVIEYFAKSLKIVGIDNAE